MSAQHESEIKQLERKINDVSDALSHLSTAEDWRRLILILKRPGWTTPAELIFATAIVDSLHSQVTALASLKGQLLQGSEAVVAK